MRYNLNIMEKEENINLNNEALEINFKVEEFEYSPEAKELREKLASLYRKDVEQAMDKIVTFAQELQTRYSLQKLHDYEAYCILVGSTPMKKPKEFDIEGDDSIVKFIGLLEKEINP